LEGRVFGVGGSGSFSTDTLGEGYPGICDEEYPKYVGRFPGPAFAVGVYLLSGCQNLQWAKYWMIELRQMKIPNRKNE